MVTMQAEVARTFLLKEVSWTSYLSLLRDMRRQRVRMTYDRGTLEFMTLSHGHESYHYLIGRLIEVFTLELGIEVHGGASTTFHKEDDQRGLEADESYWIQNEPLMRGKKEFDIETDPPPDLALEVDVTSSSINRMSIYASLGVPEVWRLEDGTLTIYCLEENREYAVREQSAALPLLPPHEVMRFLAASDKLSETQLLRSFISWIRREIKARKAEPKRRPRKK